MKSYDKDVKYNTLYLIAKGTNFFDISHILNVPIHQINIWNTYHTDIIMTYKLAMKIDDLIENRNLEEAIKICNQTEYKDSPIIQTKKIDILMKLGKLEDAFLITINPKYSSHPSIKNQKNEILTLCNFVGLEKIDKRTLKDFLKDIRDGNILLDDIKKSNFTEVEKNIFTFAYYDANHYSKKSILVYLKKAMLEYQDNENIVKALHMLWQRFQSKTNIFDIEFYRQIFYIIHKDSILKLERKKEQ